MRELRWYLEQFLDYPFHPETVHAEHVLDALKAWGTQAFNFLFDRRDAANWLAASDILQVRSDDASILSWPWEALCDPQAGYLAHERRVERRLNKLRETRRRSARCPTIGSTFCWWWRGLSKVTCATAPSLALWSN